jgi:hypothetical protein
MATDYIFTDTIDPHVERRRAILKAHPEVKKLFGRNQATFYWILFLVISQLTIAFLVKDASIWWVLGLAYFVGAFFNHSSFEQTFSDRFSFTPVHYSHQCTGKRTPRSRLCRFRLSTCYRLQF